MAKYKPFGKIPIQNRKWPENEITRAPLWCSVDLRDGNQALAAPMGVEKKLEFFELLVSIGFKQIEVGFPSASETEFNFVRRLIEERRIPPDVTIQALTQMREDLIIRTFEALKGARSAIFHIYNSTSPAQRKYTFNMTKEEIVQVALNGVRAVKKHLDMASGTKITLEYSPESFSSTEIDFALEICERVKDEWGLATPQNKMIIDLPTTVEYSTANVFADQIEYFSTQISGRDSLIVGLHNHNDRGTGVSSCELGLLAGAERVEGTLFGNGERTGNVDIVNVALNMYTQGVDIGLDFSNLPEIAEKYTELTGMEIPPRWPYAGELVFTAFSGSHQDAIRKGMAARKNQDKDAPWDVPYLPIDPTDIGSRYEAIIRINSQSGKGGSAWVLEENYGIYMPKAMHPALGKLVTAEADKLQRELQPSEIHAIFENHWLKIQSPLKILDLNETHIEDGKDGAAPVALCRASVEWAGKIYAIGKNGNGPLDAFAAALRQTPAPEFSISSFSEHSVGSGSDTDALAYVEITLKNGKKFWGCGRSSNVGRAGINALVSAINIASSPA